MIKEHDRVSWDWPGVGEKLAMRPLIIHVIILLSFGSCLTSANHPSYINIQASVAQRTVTFDICIFDTEHYQIDVIDNATPEGRPRHAHLSDLMKSGAYVAGINGGFFKTGDFQPAGQMISQGKKTGTLDLGFWTTGIFYVMKGVPKIGYKDKLTNSDSISDLLQTGPWLVENGSAKDDLAPEKRLAERSFIFEGKSGHWGFGVCSPVTLRELSTLLTSQDIKDLIVIENALNLDGGPSTGFWIKTKNGKIKSRPEKWAVRNYIVIRKK